jgi:hypothetical protein
MAAEEEAVLDAIFARRARMNRVKKKQASRRCRVGQGQAGVQPGVPHEPARGTQPAVKGILRERSQVHAKKHVRFDEGRLVSGTMLCPKWIKHMDSDDKA